MLRDNPLLTLLGRKGRGAVVDALRKDLGRDWTVRELARVAGVPAITASRAVKELEALAVVDAFRPGRDKIIRWDPDSAAAQALQPFIVPDLRGEGIRVFVQAFDGSPGWRLLRWTMPDDEPADPMCPGRIAILVASEDDEDDAWDAIGPALDAVADAGWPRPDVTTFAQDALSDDAVGRAIRAGVPL